MGLELFYLGFMDLMSDRETGMNIGPIRWTTVQHYCDKKGLDEEQTESMHMHIKNMDTSYMKISKKKSNG